MQKADRQLPIVYSDVHRGGCGVCAHHCHDPFRLNPSEDADQLARTLLQIGARRFEPNYKEGRVFAAFPGVALLHVVLDGIFEYLTNHF